MILLVRWNHLDVIYWWWSKINVLLCLNVNVYRARAQTYKEPLYFIATHLFSRIFSVISLPTSFSRCCFSLSFVFFWRRFWPRFLPFGLWIVRSAPASVSSFRFWFLHSPEKNNKINKYRHKFQRYEFCYVHACILCVFVCKKLN